MDGHQLQEEWDRVCDQLRLEIGDSDFENWLRPLSVADFDGTEGNLAVPSRFMRDWILAN